MPKRLIVFLLVFSILIYFIAFPVKSAVSSCSASVTPTTVGTNTSTTLTFSINNSDTVNIVWVKISAPSSNLTVSLGGASGWTAGVQSAQVIVFSSGSLGAGSTQSFNVDVSTGGSEVGASAWTVQTSDASDGSGAFSCSGDTSVAISVGGQDTVPPNISDITISDITSSSTKINWNTDENSTGTVSYGTTAAYGSSVSSSTSSTSHSVTISGLSASTTYHFKIVFQDSAGNSDETEDETFSTAAPGQTATSVAVTPTTKGGGKGKDTTPPSLSVSTGFSKPYKAAPTISGTASDSSGVSKVEYSIDGKNWLPVAISKGTQVSFSFTPAIFEDGDYVIRIRAEDSTGNVSAISSFRLVIDQLPPQVGANIFSLGAQLLSPNEDGTLVTFEGLEQKVTLSAIGGPITIEIVAGENRYSLAKNVESGLWTSIINFPKQGRYEVKVEAIDGAGNKTERKLNQIVVLPAGKTTWFFGKPIEGASVYVYYFEPTAGQFVLWDAGPFGQVNPQKTDKEGRYSLFLPPGKYYLEVRAPAFRTTRSTIFTLERSMPIDADFNLLPAGIRIGSLAITIPHTAISQRISLGEEIEVPEEAKKEFVGKKIEDFTPSISLRGKKTILTFLNTWLPQSSEQIVILDELLEEKKANLVVIAPQESEASIFIFKERGEYQVPMFADPEGKLVEPFNLQFLPLNLFLDENGVIKEAKVGVLDRQELLDSLD